MRGRAPIELRRGLAVLRQKVAMCQAVEAAVPCGVRRDFVSLLEVELNP